MRAEFQRIGGEFQSAKKEGYSHHPLAQLIRNEAASSVREGIQIRFPQFLVVGSAGKGQWADVPWIAVFDPAVTDSATSGFYVVYLFSARSQRLYLSLNQGTTAVRKEFKRRTHEVLRNRARILRARAELDRPEFNADPIDLAAPSVLAKDYQAGHAIGASYAFSSLPSDEQLSDDLNVMCLAYQRAIFRGGIDPTPDEDDDRRDGEERPSANSLTERRQYRLHRRIERRSGISSQVKREHGLRCAACGLLFEKMYGAIGQGYIEAHHLTPLSSLSPGTSFNYDIRRDFCVLCANCHRMIHRQVDPSDLDQLRASILTAK